jgi:hypothetical protein
MRLIYHEPDNNDSDDEETDERHMLDHTAIKAWNKELLPEEFNKFSIDSYFRDSIDFSKNPSEN